MPAETVSTLRVLKHYPAAAGAEGPRPLRSDLQIQSLAPRGPVTMPAPLPGDCLMGSGDYMAGPLFLAALRNGAVLRDGTFVFTERNELLRESVDRLASIDALSASRPDLRAELEATASEPSPETVAVVGAQRSANYFHWWIDVLSQCWLIHNSPYRNCHLVTPMPTQDFQRDSLSLLGQTVTPLTRPLHRFRNLIFARGLTSGSSENILPAVTEFAQWCRAKLRVSPSPGSRKLFITRRGARTRRLINEDRVLEVLGPDFELIEAEALSVREKASLFSEASLVVAPHGAGLTNILFCNRRTAVLELVHADSPPSTYRRLAGLLGHQYIAVGCEPSPRGGAKPGKRDMTAPAAAVAAAATRLQEPGASR